MKTIIYPPFIKERALRIGVTAPSSGLGIKAFVERYALVANQHKEKGVEVVEGKCLRHDHWYVSSTKEERVKDFHMMWSNPEVDLIQPPWGGELLIDILEYIHFDKLKESPKWIQGYSDISTLLFAITTMTGIATAHGTNFMDSIDGQDKLTANSRDYLSMGAGEQFIQTSSKLWQKEYTSFSSKPDGVFNLTEQTKWQLLNGDEAEFSGRIIGGCIDTLKHLIGTKYGDLQNFIYEFARDKGIILYFENCDQEPTELYRSLISMKYAGWFDRLNGVIFGRNNGPDKEGFSYIEVLISIFRDVKFPVVLDADIGHLPPQMTIINGSMASVVVSDKKAELVQEFI